MIMCQTCSAQAHGMVAFGMGKCTDCVKWATMTPYQRQEAWRKFWMPGASENTPDTEGITPYGPVEVPASTYVGPSETDRVALRLLESVFAERDV